MDDHRCQKEEVIGKLTTAVEFFQEAEKRRESREERMTRAVETVAAQGEIIKAHADNIGDLKKGQGILFERVRELEKAPGDEAGKVKVGFWNAIVAAVIAIVVTFLSKVPR